MITQELAAYGYLISAICFIMALRGLSSPVTSRQGNLFGVVGMVSGAVTIYVNVGNRARDRNAARQADEARTRAVDAMLPWFAYDQDHDTLPTLVKSAAAAAAKAAETSEAAQ